LLGVKEAEAFQFQDNAANVLYALIYMVLFAIPIVAMKRFGAKAPWWLKVAAALGFLMSVVGAFFTVFPIIDVQSRLLFAAKIIAVVIRGQRDRCGDLCVRQEALPIRLAFPSIL